MEKLIGLHKMIKSSQKYDCVCFLIFNLKIMSCMSSRSNYVLSLFPTLKFTFIMLDKFMHDTPLQYISNEHEGLKL